MKDKSFILCWWDATFPLWSPCLRHHEFQAFLVAVNSFIYTYPQNKLPRWKRDRFFIRLLYPQKDLPKKCTFRSVSALLPYLFYNAYKGTMKHTGERGMCINYHGDEKREEANVLNIWWYWKVKRTLRGRSFKFNRVWLCVLNKLLPTQITEWGKEPIKGVPSQAFDPPQQVSEFEAGVISVHFTVIRCFVQLKSTCAEEGPW